MNKKDLQKIKLPDTPGVYFFLKGKEIIYIGKATSLKDRASSYFGEDLINTRGPLLVDMVFHADKIKWEVTDSVLEAVILEANLIKKYQPKYNTKEKSDKSFNYVCVTKEELPRIVIKRGKDIFQQGVTPRRTFSSVFGPYTSGSQLKEALRIIRKIFPFLDDKSKNYLEFYKQINLVPDLKDHKIYLNNIKNIKLFFSGKKKDILKNLEREMRGYSKSREFEKAEVVKRQIFALKHINDVALIKDGFLKQNILERTLGRSDGDGQRKFLAKNFRGESENILQEEKFVLPFRIEAYDIAHMGGKNMVGVMTVILDGETEKGEYKKFKIRTQNNANDTGALAEILERRFLHTEWQKPELIVVDGGMAQINVALRILKKIKLKIPLVSVLKNDKHKPKAILGDEKTIDKNKSAILLANSEAHRFAINYHKNMRNRNFLK